MSVIPSASVQALQNCKNIEGKVNLVSAMKQAQRGNRVDCLLPNIAQSNLPEYFLFNYGRDSVVSIATRYELDGLGLECRWGRSFRTLPYRLQGTSCRYSGYWVTFSKQKRSGLGSDHPLLSSTEFESEQSTASASHLRLRYVTWCFQMRTSQAYVHFRTRPKVTRSKACEV